MSAALPIVRDVAALRASVTAWRRDGQSVALVPTMGALHEGHLSLVRAGKARCDKVVASLFVNPRQFAPQEDFDRYPRDETGDAALLAGAGCDLLFAPDRAAMYPDGFATSVIVANVSTPLEGEFRPHFFAGVATVVTKLLLQCSPDAAFFGEKDYQQLLVIRRLARDLDIPAEIVGCETVREPDGLAMSSRNAYLSPDQRAIAGRLNLILKATAAAIRGGSAIAAAEAHMRAEIAAAGFASIDYAAACDSETLAPLSDLSRPGRILAAAWIGKTRLIDNLPI